MLPPDASDPSSWVNKKRHLGNDFVTIVYNDSTRDFAFGPPPFHGAIRGP